MPSRARAELTVHDGGELLKQRRVRQRREPARQLLALDRAVLDPVLLEQRRQGVEHRRLAGARRADQDNRGDHEMRIAGRRR